MKTKTARAGTRVIEGSGNVFADLDLAHAEDLQLKAELTRQIHNRIRKLGLTQVQAAARLGLQQPDVSKLVNGRHTGFSADRLFAILNSLEVNVEIVLRTEPNGRRRRGTISVRETVG